MPNIERTVLGEKVVAPTVQEQHQILSDEEGQNAASIWSVEAVGALELNQSASVIWDTDATLLSSGTHAFLPTFFHQDPFPLEDQDILTLLTASNPRVHDDLSSSHVDDPGQISTMEYVNPDTTMLADTTQYSNALVSTAAVDNTHIDDMISSLFSLSHSLSPTAALALKMRFDIFELAPPGQPGKKKLMRVLLDSHVPHSSMSVTDANSMGVRVSKLPLAKRQLPVLTHHGQAPRMHYMTVEVYPTPETSFLMGPGPVVLNIAVVKMLKNQIDHENGNIVFAKEAIRKLKSGALSRASSPSSSDHNMGDSMEVGLGSSGDLTAGSMLGGTGQLLAPPMIAYDGIGGESVCTSTYISSHADSTLPSYSTAVTSDMSETGATVHDKSEAPQGGDVVKWSGWKGFVGHY